MPLPKKLFIEWTPYVTQWMFCEKALTHCRSLTLLKVSISRMPEEEAIAPRRSNWGVVMQPACSLCATKSLLRNSQGCRLFMGRWWAKSTRCCPWINENDWAERRLIRLTMRPCSSPSTWKIIHTAGRWWSADDIVPQRTINNNTLNKKIQWSHRIIEIRGVSFPEFEIQILAVRVV